MSTKPIRDLLLHVKDRMLWRMLTGRPQTTRDADLQKARNRRIARLRMLVRQGVYVVDPLDVADELLETDDVVTFEHHVDWRGRRTDRMNWEHEMDQRMTSAPVSDRT